MKTKLLSVLVIAVLAAAGGCKKDKGDNDDKADDKKPTAGKTTQDQKKPPEPKQEWTAADTVKRVEECTSFWNSGEIDKLAACYGDSGKVTMVDHIPPAEFTGADEIAAALKEWLPAFPDSKMEPQAVLVNGNNYAVIALSTGTNKGELMGKPATNKKTAVLGAQIGVVDDEGNIVTERHLADQSTTMHQLGIASNPMAPDAEEPWADTVRATAESSETEEANVAAFKKLSAAGANKDAETMAAQLADDVTFRWVPSKEVAEGKEAYIKGVKQYFGMHETIDKNVKEAWGAGDWVVAVVETKGKLGVDMPGAKGTKGKEYTTTQFEFTRFEDGKLKQQWVFDNSLAMMVQIGAVDPAELAPPADGAAPDKKKKMKK